MRCAGFKEAFASERLFLGGPVHLDHVTLLHRFVGVRSHKIAEGMFMGEAQCEGGDAASARHSPLMRRARLRV